jgi:HEAT repeat protein
LAGDDDALVRAAAAGALGRVGDPNYLPALVSALKDRSAEVRLDTANALDLLTGEAAVEPLRKSATEDASVDVRAACARALRHYRRKEVGQTLLKCLDDDAFEVRHQSHATLTELTGNDAGISGEEWRDLLDREPLTQPLPGRPWWNLLKK